MWNIGLWTGGSAAGVGSASDTAFTDGVAGQALVISRMHASFYDLRRRLYEMSDESLPPVIAAHPSIGIFGWVPPPNSSPGTDGELVTDVATDHGRALPSSDGRVSDTAAAWSIATVLAERIVKTNAIGGQSEKEIASDSSFVDVLTAFDTARQQHQPHRALFPSDVGAIDQIPSSDQARARMRRELDGGRVLLLPMQRLDEFSPMAAWWVVDPDHGVIRDQLENGRHGQAAEYQGTNEPPRRAASAYQRLGCWVSKVARVAGMMLTLAGAASGNAEAMSAAKGMLKLDSAMAKAAAEEADRKRKSLIEQMTKGGCKGA